MFTPVSGSASSTPWATLTLGRCRWSLLESDITSASDNDSDSELLFIIYKSLNFIHSRVYSTLYIHRVNDVQLEFLINPLLKKCLSVLIL